MKRYCTVCLTNGSRTPAEFVASDATGLQWYECSGHSETDNVAGVVRTRLEPIESFLAGIGCPPGRDRT